MTSSLPAFSDMILRQGDNMARRRLQKEGHLYKDGGWWRLPWREDVIGDSGLPERRRMSTVIDRCEGAGALTERQAKRKAWDLVLSKVNQRELIPQSLTKLADFVEMQFKPEYVLALKLGSQVHYRVQLTHVVAELGGVSLREVKHEHVQRPCLGLLAKTYQLGKDGPRRPYSVQAALHLKNAVSAVFEHAKAVGMYSGENPARYVRLPEMRRKLKHSLTVDQMKLVLAALPSPALEMAHVAVLTSMNIAEICGLVWKFVNLTDAWVIVDGEPVPPLAIAVRQQWSTRKGGGAYHSLKAGTRRRNLPVDAALAKILRSVAAQSTFTGPEDAVFVSGTGRPVDAHNLSNRVLRPVGAKLGMPWLGWHVFRHTFASWARQEALSPADQMASLGHGDIRMTMQYGEQDLDRRRGVVGKLAAKLSPKKPAAKAMAMAGAN